MAGSATWKPASSDSCARRSASARFSSKPPPPSFAPFAFSSRTTAGRAVPRRGSRWVSSCTRRSRAGTGSPSTAAFRATRRSALEPGLRPEGLTSASFYWDAQMDDALLCVAVAVDAARAGADVRTYTRVTGLTREGSSWRARFRDALDGAEGDVEARFVVNASGPWADDVRGMALETPSPSVRRTRGTHIVLPGLTRSHALLLTARRDGRVFFVIPWGSVFSDRDHRRGRRRSARRRGPSRGRHPVSFRRERPGRARGARWAPPRPDVRGNARARARRRGQTLDEYARASSDRGAGHGHDRRGKVHDTSKSGGAGGGRCGASHRTARGPEPDGCPAAGRRPRGRDRVSGGESPGSAGPGRRSDDPRGRGRARGAHEKARRVEDVLLRRSRLWLDGRALRRAAAPTAAWMAGLLQWPPERARGEAEAMTRALEDEDRRIEEGTR